MRINNNISALTAYTNILQNGRKTSSSMMKLSSGYRINSASDNASGLAISYKMRMQVSGTSAASKNSIDGISLIQTAEGALQQVHNMVQRMRELSVQASNGTYEPDDIEKMQMEIDEMMKEINNIHSNTEYNKIPILTGMANMRIESPNASILNTSSYVQPGEYRFNVIAEATKTEVSTVVSNWDSADAAEKAGTIDINGYAVAISSSDTIEDVFTKLRGAVDSFGYDALYSGDSTSFEITFSAQQYGQQQAPVFQSDNPDLLVALGLTTASVTVGNDASIDIITKYEDGNSAFSNTAYYEVNGGVVTFKDIDGQFFVADISDSSKLNDSNFNFVHISDAPLIIQTGANKDMEMEIYISKINSVSLRIDGLDCTTFQGAQKAIGDCDAALDQISTLRARLGAYQNRLEYTVANLDIYEENLSSSYSRLKDTDMALEMTNMTKGQVIEQVGMAILSQANQRPQALMQLM